MEQRCETCRYFELDPSTLPCSECNGCKNANMYVLWRKDIDEVENNSELLRAIFEMQMYMFREIERIRIKLEKEK